MKKHVCMSLGCSCLVILAMAGFAHGVDKTWNQSGSGSGANPAFWTPTGVPGSSDTAILPKSGQFYTVTTDVLWHIDDLEIQRFATGWINGFNLNGGGDIYGTLYVQNATFTGSSLSLKTGSSGNGTLQLANATVAGSVNTSASSQILGYGTINGSLNADNGLIRAEDGILNIDLYGNDHNNGTLSAATGGTLYIRNTSNITNRAAIDLQGGTLWGYQYNTYNLINNDSCQITGRGIIDRFYVQNNTGGIIAPAGGTLSLAKGFASAYNSGTINLITGATLNVGQAAWSNYGIITMTGGAITGQTLNQVQSHTLSVTAAATNTIENATFSAPYGAAISNGAALSITGTGTLQNSTILALTGGGKFNVSTGAVQGRGVIEPGMDIGGTLTANSSGNTLTVSGDMTVLAAGTAKAESSGTLNLSGSVRNRNEVKAAGGNVTATGTLIAATDATGDFSAASGQMNLSSATFQTALRNTFTAYAGGTITLPGGFSTANLYETQALRPRGGTITVPNGTTLTHGTGKSILGYGTLLESGCSVANRGDIRAITGTLELRGTVLADPANTGDFGASEGTLVVAAALESNLYNTFSAYNAGTVRFQNSLNTALFAGDGLRPYGGTITLDASGATLTNATGKTIAGYGHLLGGSLFLNNQGTIQAAYGNLRVYGTVTNHNTMKALNDGTLTLTGTLINSGEIYTTGNSAVSIADTAPTGSGIATANIGGTIRLSSGFTNAYLSTPDAIQLNGGTVALSSSGSMTNETGKIIRGHGTLLESDQTLNNKGLLEAVGNLVINGSVINTGNTIGAASAGDTLYLHGGLTNTGLVELGPEASLTASTIFVTGGITGGGRISLEEASMTVRASLAVQMSGFLTDNGQASDITVLGELDNRSTAFSDFQLTHTTLSSYSLALIGKPRLLTWQSQDLGAEFAGLDHNMAIGSLIFGDGLGLPQSDAVTLTPESTIYTYGLHIQEDAYLDLGGQTIYYLRSGVEYNGIIGTGFILEGAYDNGQIIEIIPEPLTMLLLSLGGLVSLRGRRKN